MFELMYKIKQVEISENSLEKDLANAHCAISYTSGASIDAMMNGIPVITPSPYNFVYGISSHDLENVENPILGDRLSLLYKLSYTQWSVEEIIEGKPLKAFTMNIAVVTTLNKKLYKQYGYKFFETYNWPFDLIVYSEDLNDIPHTDIVVRSIFDEIPECEFINRNKHRPVSDDPRTGFLKDGVRFCYKVYAYTNEVLTSEDYDGIIGIDADSIFYKKNRRRLG